jgi:thiamine-phosphate pyrophosphorylase
MIALDAARLYLVARANLAAGVLADLVPELVVAGVDLVQLREKEMEAGDLLRVGESVAEACRAAGVPFILNDRPDVALALRAAGVHLGINDLPTAFARRVMGRDAIVGRSTHSEDDITSVLRHEDPDYIAVGPVHATPTKPGRPAAGIELIRHAAAAVNVPWFAIGGIDAATLPDLLEAGARRIVVVRAITEAADPVVEAARLKEMLAGAAL